MADIGKNSGSKSTDAIQNDDYIKPLTRPNLKKRGAMKILHRYMILSAAAGLIPVPFYNQVVLGGLLAKMLYDLCEFYKVKMSEHKIKTSIASILGGAHSDWISFYVLEYSNKYLPGANNIARIVTRPIISAAITYAVGILYIHHFEKGAWK